MKVLYGSHFINEIAKCILMYTIDTVLAKDVQNLALTGDQGDYKQSSETRYIHHRTRMVWYEDTW